MANGSAHWNYDAVAGAWYIKLDEREPGPYSTQIKVTAILDLDRDGRLAGIEILECKPDGSPLAPPLNAAD